MIDAVIFDMDGVIIDSEPVWQQVRVEFMSEHGGRWTDADGDACRGRASSVWAGLMAERLDGAISAETVFERVLERMVDSYEDALPLFPGAVEAIRRISNTYTIAVASGSPTALIDVVLRKTGIDKLCSAVGYGDEVQQGKPAPDIYLDVLERLGAVASKTVGVEDSESGLRSVQAAGMRSIAVVSSEYQLSRDVLAGTVARIPALSELTPSMVKAIGGVDSA